MRNESSFNPWDNLDPIQAVSNKQRLAQIRDLVSRRSFLQRPGISLGAMALGSLLSQSGMDKQAFGVDGDAGNDSDLQRNSRGILNPLHIVPKAKRVIWLYMAGGMTHLETFDHKPKLAEMHGKPMPESITKGQQIAQIGRAHV